MAPRIWDSYKTFNITARDSDGMFCVGLAVTKGNSRCRITITGEECHEVCSILDKMETKPPNEVSKLLPRLARLSLCNEYHQHQERGVLEKWREAIEDVVKRYEKVERLKSRIHRLSFQLTMERKEREQLEDLMSERPDELNSDACVKLTVQVDELRSQLEVALLTSTQYEKCYTKSEAGRVDLLWQVDKLQKSLTESLRESKRLAAQEAELSRRLTESLRESKLLAAQKAQLSRRLTAELEASETYKMDAETRRANQSQRIDDLQSELTEEHCISAQRQADVRVTASQIDKLQSQLATERQVSELLRGDLGKAMADRTVLLEQIKALQAQLSSERQNSDQLKKNLDEGETSQAVVSKEMGNLRSQLATERQTSSQSEKKLESLTTQLASAQSVLEDTQLDLTRSRRTNEEQTATAAARDLASAAETTRLLDRIRQLEDRPRATFLNAFRGMIKRLAECIAPWVTDRWWQRRGNRMEEDFQE